MITVIADESMESVVYRHSGPPTKMEWAYEAGRLLCDTRIVDRSGRMTIAESRL